VPCCRAARWYIFIPKVTAPLITLIMHIIMLTHYICMYL
jgi:hypothetical protein